jgi:hypothetical protein
MASFSKPEIFFESISNVIGTFCYNKAWIASTYGFRGLFMGSNEQRSSEIVLSARDFFQETVGEAFRQRNVKTLPLVKSYLVELLEFYVPTSNLFDDFDSSGKRTRATLAETFLIAQNSEQNVRIELLKKLGDRSLYISGFFGDSLQRKLVDVDYYADMGCAAYSSLAAQVSEDMVARLYEEIAGRFNEFAEVLNYISSLAHITNEENIMRLYETYARTGSDLAREKLNEKGLIAVPLQSLTKKNQQ